MFTHLIASEGKKSRLTSVSSLGASGVIHAILLVAVAYGTVQTARAEKEMEEVVAFVDIKEAEPEPPKAEEPPPPPPEAPKPETPPPPKGFQELIPPKEPPPVIPEVDLSAPAVKAEDFSGLGQAGGTASGVAGGTPQNAAATPDSSNYAFAYEVAVLDRKPELINTSQVQSMMTRLYPRMLQDAGIEGTVMLQFVITAEGKVDVPTVKVVSSTHDLFAEASVKAVEKFRFRPGRYKGQPVRVLIQMPIAWKPQQ